VATDGRAPAYRGWGCLWPGYGRPDPKNAESRDKVPGQAERTVLTLEEKRPFIDRACKGELRDDDGYGP
jgi:hypothetical protein